MDTGPTWFVAAVVAVAAILCLVFVVVREEPAPEKPPPALSSPDPIDARSLRRVAAGDKRLLEVPWEAPRPAEPSVNIQYR